MKKLATIALSLALGAGLISCKNTDKPVDGKAPEPKAEAKFPERDITNIVVWSAGGGTDQANRVISQELGKELGVNVVVQNVPGGVAGSLGMSQAYSKPSDGYTLVGLAGAEASATVQGGWNERFTVWHPYIVGGSPSVISVKGDSEYKTLAELVDAAKAKPGTIKASASGSGSPHHLNLLALEKGTDAKFSFIPYKGSAESQTAAVTGEVSVVVTTVAEQISLLKGKQLKPLAVLIPKAMDVDGVGKLPTAFETYPQLKAHLPLMQQIGFSLKDDAPDAVKQRIGKAFEKAMASPKLKAWAKQNYYVLSGKWGKEAKAEYAKLESVFSWTLHELGSTKVDPAKLSIPKP